MQVGSANATAQLLANLAQQSPSQTAEKNDHDKDDGASAPPAPTKAAPPPGTGQKVDRTA